MTLEQLLARYAESLNEVMKYRDLYADGNPIISDDDYDTLYNGLVHIEAELAKIDTKYINPQSPTQTMGSFKTDGTKVAHLTPYVKIPRVYNENDIKATLSLIAASINWIKGGDTSIMPMSVSETTILEPKYDGVAITLVYRDGILERALTQGSDGVVGNEVTKRLYECSKWLAMRETLMIKTPPHLIEIRGEAVIHHDNLKVLNDARVQASLEPYKTCRNAVVGLLNGSSENDHPLVASILGDMIYFIAHGVCTNSFTPNVGSYSLSTHYDAMCFLERQGFFVPEMAIVELCIDDLSPYMEYYNALMKRRSHLPYDIDGFMIKVNDYQMSHYLSSTGKASPIFAVKFPSETKPAVLENIEWSVGAMGFITPVAIIKPIILGGVEITRVNLYNAAYVVKHQLAMNDTILVARAGDVIPKMISKIMDGGHHLVFTPPIYCPACQTPLDAMGDVCHNTKCRGRQLGKLRRAIDSNGFNLPGVHQAALATLYDNGIVEDPLDLYRLSDSAFRAKGCPELMEVPSVKSLMKIIQASRTITLTGLIYSVGIEQMGLGYSTKIARMTGTLDQLIKDCRMIKAMAKPNEWVIMETFNYSGLNRSIAKKLLDLSEALDYLESVLDIPNLTVLNASRYDASDAQYFTITGSFSEKRSSIIERYRLRGYTYAINLSAKCRFLLVGDNPSQTKLDLANSLNVPINTQLEYF